MSRFYDPDPDDLALEDEVFDLDPEDLEGAGPRCVGCGCTEDNPCDGGCIWASETLCSRCA